MTFTSYAASYARMLDLIEKAVNGMSCDCYDPDEMEYHPTYVCPKHQLLRILETKPDDDHC